MVEAVDHQLGRSKQTMDSDDETVAPRKKTNDEETEDDQISHAGPSSEARLNSEAELNSERILIEKMNDFQQKQQDKMKELLANAFSIEKLESIVEKVLAKKNNRLT